MPGDGALAEDEGAFVGAELVAVATVELGDTDVEDALEGELDGASVDDPGEPALDFDELDALLDVATDVLASAAVLAESPPEPDEHPARTTVVMRAAPATAAGRRRVLRMLTG